jgi:hypothetical protein
MKFKALCRMQSRPGFSLGVSAAPVAFRAQAGGSLEMRVGPLTARVSEGPIRLAIPFRRGGRLPVVATIGGVRFALESFPVNVERARLELDGVLGTGGIESKVEGRVDCTTEMQATGALHGRLVIPQVEFGDDEPDTAGQGS